MILLMSIAYKNPTPSGLKKFFFVKRFPLLFFNSVFRFTLILFLQTVVDKVFSV